MVKLLFFVFFFGFSSIFPTDFSTDQKKRELELCQKFQTANAEIGAFDVFPLVIASGMFFFGATTHSKKGGNPFFNSFLIGGGLSILFLKYWWRTATLQRCDRFRQYLNEYKQFMDEKKKNLDQEKKR